MALGFQRTIERTGEPRVRRQLRELSQLSAGDWIIPVSPSAIDSLAAFMQREPGFLHARVALIGPGSLERWQQAIPTEQLNAEAARPLLPRSTQYDALSLVSEPEFATLNGRRIVIIAGTERRAAWADQLLARGARVDVIAAYQVESVVPSSQETLQLIAWLGDWQPAEPRTAPVMLASSVAIARLCQVWIRQSLPIEWQVRLKHCWWLANHAKVANSLTEAGWTQVRTIEPGEHGLLEALESLQ